MTIFLVKAGKRMTAEEFWQEGFDKAIELSPSDLSLLMQACASSIHDIKFSCMEPSWIVPKIRSYEALLKKLEGLK